MRRSPIFLAIAVVVVLLVAVAGLVGWAAGHYTKNTVTVGTTTPASSSQVAPTVAARNVHRRTDALGQVR